MAVAVTVKRHSLQMGHGDKEPLTHRRRPRELGRGCLQTSRRWHSLQEKVPGWYMLVLLGFAVSGSVDLENKKVTAEFQ